MSLFKFLRLFESVSCELEPLQNHQNDNHAASLKSDKLMDFHLFH